MKRLITLLIAIIFTFSCSDEDKQPKNVDQILILGRSTVSPMHSYYWRNDYLEEVILSNGYVHNIVATSNNSNQLYLQLLDKTIEGTKYRSAFYKDGKQADIENLEGSIFSGYRQINDKDYIFGFKFGSPFKSFYWSDNEINYLQVQSNTYATDLTIDSAGNTHIIGKKGITKNEITVFEPIYWVNMVPQLLDFGYPINGGFIKIENINDEIHIIGIGYDYDTEKRIIFDIVNGITNILMEIPFSEGSLSLNNVTVDENDLYICGAYKSYNGDSYGFYIKNNEVVKVTNPSSSYVFSDIAIIHDQIHLVGYSYPKENESVISSLYLIDGITQSKSGIPNLELKEIKFLPKQ